MAFSAPISVSSDPLKCVSFVQTLGASSSSSTFPTGIFRLKLKSEAIELTHLRSFKKTPRLLMKASSDPTVVVKEVTNDKPRTITEAENGDDLFNDLKDSFLKFKKFKYQENLEHYQNLAQRQTPKFMVIACADSRVCPSNILGFQPGEAFVIRNVANLVPPFESGPTETNAALEFAVNSLQVPNILIVGHSCCGGIRALMSMKDDVDTNGGFINSWVVVGNDARMKTKASASNLSFDHQCRHCEKESINHSLSNLLTYPWIQEKVEEGKLSVHGGYYDFIDCTFEKWTLDYRGEGGGECSSFAVKDRHFWS